jgi:hypothetical protein
MREGMGLQSISQTNNLPWSGPGCVTNESD